MLTNQGFPPLPPCLLLPPLSSHSISKFLLSKHFKSKWFCCLNPLVSLTLFFFLVFLKNFQTKWSFPSLPSLFSMIGHNKPYIGNICQIPTMSFHIVNFIIIRYYFSRSGIFLISIFNMRYQNSLIYTSIPFFPPKSLPFKFNLHLELFLGIFCTSI